MALPPSKVLGIEFAGTVVACGAAVDAAKFAPGDRVAGGVHGGRYSHTGAFAEQVVADANICFRVPENVSLERACTVGTSWLSAAQALRQRLWAGDPLDGPLGDDTVRISHAPWWTGQELTTSHGSCSSTPPRQLQAYTPSSRPASSGHPASSLPPHHLSTMTCSAYLAPAPSSITDPLRSSKISEP